MALEYASGTITFEGANPTQDPVGTTKTVSGLSFQPKAIRFVYWCGSVTFHTTDTAAQTGHNCRPGIGFATSTTNRYAMGSKNDDGAGSVSGGQIWTDSGCVISPANTTAVLKADINAINSDGFELILDVSNGAGATIFWEAWGGSDITVAQVIQFDEPAATGDQDYTVTGFTAGATDQVVMFAGINGAHATDTADATLDSGFMVGFATSGADADNVVVVSNNDDASASSDSDGYCKTGECVAMIVAGGGNPNARAKLTQFGTDNFRLNWIARGVTGRRYIALAIKGGQWKAGSYTINGNTGSATATVSGLAFQPTAILTMGRMTAEDTAGTSTAEARMSLGRGSSTTSRNCYGYLDEDATASVEIDIVFEYDQVLAFPSTTGTLQSAYDISAINSDGFTMIVDTAGGVASEWQGYLTFASASATAYSLDLSPGSYILTGAAAGTLADRIINASPGSYALTGFSAVVGRERFLDLSPGAYTITGVSAGLIADRVLNASPGTYILTGAAAAAVAAKVMNADPGSYTITGSNIATVFDRVLNAAPGSYVIVGANAELFFSGAPPADPNTDYVVVIRRRRR